MSDDGPRITCVTHDGAFHADDVLAYAVLREVVDPDALVRSRDPAWTSPAPGRIVFDVGGEHDDERLLFDHHQPGRPGRSDGTPYSSFGLVWRVFGRAYVESIASEIAVAGEAVLDTAWRDVDEGLVREIDAVDNGVAVPPPGPAHLATFVDGFNPTGRDPARADRAFAEASGYAGVALRLAVSGAVSERVAEAKVREAAGRRPSSAVVVLDEPLPWGRLLAQAEFADVLYVVSPRESDGSWTCRAVPVAPGSFECRRPLPAAWSGLRDGTLAAVTGVDDAVFCHAGRFLAVARSREGGMALAALAQA